jgi:integrase
MPRKKREQAPPPGARETSKGRWSITFPPNHQGQRLSQAKILPNEPRSYDGIDAAWKGFHRVNAYLKQQVDHSLTLAGFSERWLDEKDARWGVKAKRKRGTETRVVYASRIAAFVRMFGTRPIASLTEADIIAYQHSPGYRQSQMTVISTLLRDAERDRLRIGNPAREIAKEAEEALREYRKDNRPKAPKLDAIEALLLRLQDAVFPRSLYGWFLTGARTGMRGGEIDGMQFEYLDMDTGVYDIQWQLHGRSNTLERPKHKSMRKVYLPDEVMAEIATRPRYGSTDYIWLNTQHMPWRHDARDKWWTWDKDGGPTLISLVDGVSMYNATRHHWASWAVNEGGLTPYQASLLFGHKDGGKLIIERYVTADIDLAVEAARSAYQQAPRSLNLQRAKRKAA